MFYIERKTCLFALVNGFAARRAGREPCAQLGYDLAGISAGGVERQCVADE